MSGMEYPPPVVAVEDAKAIIADKKGDLWLPLSESHYLSRNTETVDVAGVFFDVIGYSEEREALLIEPIIIEGAAKDLEVEVQEFLSGE